MKKNFRIIILLALSALTLTACDKNDDPINGGNNGNVDNTAKERDIIYTVGNNEGHRTLTTEAEWDAMLDQLCDQARNGNEVTFYNMNQLTYLQDNAKGGTKDNHTISTADRDELKRWMKAKEMEGLTVRVTYDDNTGTWNGTAYATAPVDSTADNLIGTWRFNCMVVTRVDLDGELQGSDLYAPEDNGGSWYYSFSNDGTLTITFNGMDGTTATDSSTWTLSDDGILYSALLPSGAYWNVNWITPNTMIISRADLGTEEGDQYYQLQFDRQ